ncbi:hypothetical protein ABFS82_06G107300 [Erythranthe guttata]|uniref:uncharacterized protein LOC105977420 n=1 Tax=Erythranthe guttata TaxID=4155 RepID=UPI00064D7AFF|nr:PREDICTED: uncharacterized protein LOC105977420 [Erythranthe guttata]|eukprot:XP_012858183.1 PREDICTED: uncharacterized protein LOC105977420 [Erythranthe guttata]
MATPAHRLIQDQNLNILYNGSTPGVKADVTKADKRGGGLGGRKALNDISNSRKPSMVHSVRKDNNPTNVISIDKDSFDGKAKLSKAAEKGKAGGRKALRDLTNSVKPPPKLAPSVGRKLNAVAEEKFPGSVVEERFLHNHRECVAAQAKAVDMDYFLMSVGLSNDIPVKLSGRKALQLSSKKAESKMKHLEMEEISAEHLCGDEVVRFKKSELSPACRSPKSPRAPYTNWEDDELSELMVIQTP